MNVESFKNDRIEINANKQFCACTRKQSEDSFQNFDSEPLQIYHSRHGVVW